MEGRVAELEEENSNLKHEIIALEEAKFGL